MKNERPSPRCFSIISLLFVLLAMGRQSLAGGKLDLYLGYYSLSAKTNEKRTNVQNFGSYQINYRTPIAAQVELSIGYSLIATQIYTGDLGFGPDIGMTYFPFSQANPLHVVTPSITIESFEIYKPYLIGAFHQRQYQSIQSSYAGFSFGVGLEVYLLDRSYINTQVRYLPLGGPEKSTSDETDILLGLTFTF